jgi:hypothetical protein
LNSLATCTMDDGVLPVEGHIETRLNNGCVRFPDS